MLPVIAFETLIPFKVAGAISKLKVGDTFGGGAKSILKSNYPKE